MGIGANVLGIADSQVGGVTILDHYNAPVVNLINLVR